MKRSVLTGFAAWLVYSAIPLSIHAFVINQADRNVQGETVIHHESDPTFYYILHRGTNIAQIVSPVDMALGVQTEGQLLDNSPASSAAFYRVLRVPAVNPLDTDGDGIDDVWELQFRFPGAALNSSDANQDQTGNGTPDLSDYWDSLPLIAWFTNAETSALSYSGTINVPIRFTKPVTGVYGYEIGGNASAGKDYQALSGAVSLNNSLVATIPIQLLPSTALTGPRSIVLTLKTPASNVVSRIPATPAEGNASWRRFSSHTITIRDADQGLYTGNLSFLSETTRTVENGQTNVTIVPSPAVSPSTLRMALRSGPSPQAVIELPEFILFTNRLNIPVILSGNLQGFHSPSPVNGLTLLSKLDNRPVAWLFEFSNLTFTNQGALLDAECSITLNGLTASGIPRVLKGTISASRIDP